MDGLAQECNISITIVLEILQSYTKPSMSLSWTKRFNGIYGAFAMLERTGPSTIIVTAFDFIHLLSTAPQLIQKRLNCVE